MGRLLVKIAGVWVPVDGADDTGVSGRWTWKTGFVNPASGQISADTEVASTITSIKLSETTATGSSVEGSLDALQVGDILYFQDNGDSTNHVLGTVVSEVDGGGFRTFSITVTESNGTFSADAAISLSILLGTGTHMRWADVYVGGTTYQFNDVSRDGDWLGIANTQTTDRIAPQFTGLEDWISDLAGGATFAAQAAVDEAVWMVGNTFLWPEGGYTTDYRYQVPDVGGGFIYSLWTIVGLGSPDESITETVGPHIPSVANDWIEVPAGQVLWPPGQNVSIILVAKAATAETTFSSTWALKRKNGDPSSGEANFQNNNQEIRVHHFDKAVLDQQLNLEAVTVGGALAFGGDIWTITSKTNDTTFVTYFLTPNQGRPGEADLLLQFDYGSVGLIPSTRDDNFYLSDANILGFEGNALDNLTPNEHGYAVDLYVQEAVQSPDWDIMALSGAGGGSGGSSSTTFLGLDDTEPNYTLDTGKLVVVKTTEDGLRHTNTLDNVLAFAKGPGVDFTVTSVNVGEGTPNPFGLGFLGKIGADFALQGATANLVLRNLVTNFIDMRVGSLMFLMDSTHVFTPTYVRLLGITVAGTDRVVIGDPGVSNKGLLIESETTGHTLVILTTGASQSITALISDLILQTVTSGMVKIFGLDGVEVHVDIGEIVTIGTAATHIEVDDDVITGKVIAPDIRARPARIDDTIGVVFENFLNTGSGFQFLNVNGGTGSGGNVQASASSFHNNTFGIYQANGGSGGTATDERLTHHRGFNRNWPSIIGGEHWVEFRIAISSSSNGYSTVFGMAQTDQIGDFDPLADSFPAEFIGIEIASGDTNCRLRYDNANVTLQNVDTTIPTNDQELTWNRWRIGFDGTDIIILNEGVLVATIVPANQPTGNGRYLAPFFYAQGNGASFTGLKMDWVSVSPILAENLYSL